MPSAPRVKNVSPRRQRAPGRPFSPGVSGNPSGHPKGWADVQALARRMSSPAIKTLVDLMRHGKLEQTRLSAAVALLDRGWGKPLQRNEDVTPPRDLSALSAYTPEQLMEFASLAKAYQSGHGGEHESAG